MAAVKITSLVDAFNKPFLVGGLKRAIKAVEPTTSTAGKEMTARAGDKPVNGKGKDSESEPTTTHGTESQTTASSKSPSKSTEMTGQAEREESPDWPEDVDDEEDDDDVLPVPPDPPRGRAPSRSPGLSPELRHMEDDETVGAAWQDPLDDEEEDGDEPVSKRARTGS